MSSLVPVLKILSPVLYLLVFIAALTVLVIFSRMAVRKDLNRLLAAGLTAVFVLLLLAGWWFVTKGATVESRVLPPLILPSPAEVLHAFPRLHWEQGVVLSAFVSFKRVTIGFSLAALAAVVLGVYMASYKPIAAFFKPLEVASAYIPIIVFIPLTLAWWGSGEVQKIGFLFIACFVALLPLIIKSISDVKEAYLDVAKTKGASQWQLVRHVLFPVALPDIWDHLRVVYAVGWGWIILAEVVNAQKGLGYLMSVAERRSHTEFIFAIIIIIVAIAVLCDMAWKYGGLLLFPYRRRSR